MFPVPDVSDDVPSDHGGGPDLMMFLVPIAKDATCTMTVEYSPSTIDLEKKSKINLSSLSTIKMKYASSAQISLMSFTSGDLHCSILVHCLHFIDIILM